MLFELLDGVYVESVLVGKDGNGNPITQNRHYRKGAVFESDPDLCGTIHNPPGAPPKFRNMNDKVQVEGFIWNPKRESLDQFTERVRKQQLAAAGLEQTTPVQREVKLTEHTLPRTEPELRDPADEVSDDQLRTICESEELDVPEGATRAQLLDIIRTRK